MNEELKKVADGIFVNPKIAAKIVNLVTSAKPVGWAHHSNAPYYKALYANELKPFVDKMLEDKQDILYRYSVWCAEPTGMSPQTLYIRVNQSIRYLIDFMDDDQHTYASWYEFARVERIRNLGVRISYPPGFGNSDGVKMVPESVSPKVTKPEWFRKMDEWLEDGDNFEPFVKEGLALSNDEIMDIKIKLSALTNIQSSITEDRVAIIRLG